MKSQGTDTRRQTGRSGLDGGQSGQKSTRTGLQDQNRLNLQKPSTSQGGYQPGSDARRQTGQTGFQGRQNLQQQNQGQNRSGRQSTGQGAPSQRYQQGAPSGSQGTGRRFKQQNWTTPGSGSRSNFQGGGNYQRPSSGGQFTNGFSSGAGSRAGHGGGRRR